VGLEITQAYLHTAQPSSSLHTKKLDFCPSLDLPNYCYLEIQLFPLPQKHKATLTAEKRLIFWEDCAWVWTACSGSGLVRV